MRRDNLRKPGDWLISPTSVAIALGLLGVLVGFGGYTNQYCNSNLCNSLPNLGEGMSRFIKDFYGNIATTLLGIAIAVFTIDRANERRADRQADEKMQAQLIRQMGSIDNGLARLAVEELRARGWLEDGSLREAELRGADLHGVALYGADLQEAKLEKANLQGANLAGANLHRAYLPEADLQGKAYLSEADLRNANLHRAKLQEAGLGRAKLQGALLQGAYLQATYLEGAKLQKAILQGAKLQGANLSEAELQGANLHWAKLHGAILFRTNLEGAEVSEHQLVTADCLRGATMPDGSLYDGRFKLSRDFDIPVKELFDTPEKIAPWYGVTLEVYLAGQEWADENLPRLRREAGLAEEEAVETAEAPQPEELQSVPSSSSAPPVLSTQSLLSFTVRRLIGLVWPFIL